MPTSWLEKVTKKAGGEVGAADGDPLVGDREGETLGTFVEGETVLGENDAEIGTTEGDPDGEKLGDPVVVGA